MQTEEQPKKKSIIFSIFNRIIGSTNFWLILAGIIISTIIGVIMEH